MRPRGAGVLAGIVALFVWGPIPVEVTAIGATLVLWATGVLELDQALAGFGDATVVFIASLFVVSEALDRTGVTAWAGQQLIDRAGESRTRLVVLMMLLVAGLTAIISVNGAVAALLPVVVVLATRTRRPASLLLIPLVFGAHAGSMLALTGTPVNVLISNAAADYGAEPFGFFEFGLVGVPLLAGTLAVVVLTVDYGGLPWIALTLAFSFGTYGLLKKTLDMGAVESLSTETAILAPAAGAYLLFLLVTGNSAMATEGPGMATLLASLGVITVVPLLFFGAAATRLPLTWIGLLQYSAPVLQFLIGVFVYDEPMPASRWVGFGLVWSALVILTVDSLLAVRRGRTPVDLEVDGAAQEAH